jgi:hypothetical protein
VRAPLPSRTCRSTKKAAALKCSAGASGFTAGMVQENAAGAGAVR